MEPTAGFEPASCWLRSGWGLSPPGCADIQKRMPIKALGHGRIPRPFAGYRPRASPLLRRCCRNSMSRQRALNRHRRTSVVGPALAGAGEVRMPTRYKSVLLSFGFDFRRLHQLSPMLASNSADSW